MIKNVINIAKKAGDKVLEIYASGDYSVTNKNDGSPITLADLASDKIIIEELHKISDFPILTEENYIDYEIRKNWDKFWIVDSLDGTKDFIIKNNQFTINIALIEKHAPVLGVIYAPALGLMYWAEKNKGSFKNGIKIKNNSQRKELISTDSNFHSSQATLEFLQANKIVNVKKFGSAIKFGKLAEGEIDIYPRFNGSKEWDTAAGHIILNEANCEIIDLMTKTELRYNKMDVRNNFFIAQRKGLNLI